MKKLLMILSSLGITASMSTVVVACGNSNSVHRFPNLVLGDKLRDQILVSLKSDESLSDITNGKRFADIATEDIVLQMVQDNASKLANEYFKNNVNERLKLSELKHIYQNQISEIASDLARNQFYVDYTNKILTQPALSYDQELSIGGDVLTTLNPQNLLRNDNVTGTDRLDTNEYAIFMREADATPNPDGSFNWLRWQFAGENDDWIDQLPNIKQLENNDFIILKNQNQNNIDIQPSDLEDQTKLFYKESDGTPVSAGYLYSLDGEKALRLSGKNALEYRFQEYFTSHIKSKNFANLLAMTYLDKDLFRISRNENKTFSNQDTFLNISSNVAQTLQSWNQPEGYSSKVKMVWSFTFDTSEKVDEARNLIFGFLNHDGSIQNSSQRTLESLYSLLEQNIEKNSSTLGTDPFFNLNGYAGIVKNDGNGSVTRVDGMDEKSNTLNIPEAAKTKIANTNSPRVISADDRGQGFESVNPKNKFEYIFVLPIYLIDLLNDRTEGYDNGQSTTAFGKIDQNQEKIDTSILYTGYGEAMEASGKKLSDTKKSVIQDNLNQTKNWVIYVDGVPYTIPNFNVKFGTSLPEDASILTITLPTLPDNQKIDGIQFTLENSIANIFGNIGIKPYQDEKDKANPKADPSQWIKLGPNLTTPSDIPDKILFDDTRGDGNLYVRPLSETLTGNVESFSNFKLSFDDATKDGVYTVNGTIDDGEKQGRTYSYKVNLGQSASDANGYIKNDNNDFDYYELNVSSLDISNLSSAKKTALLREIEYIASKESGVIDTAASNIYPLFLEGDQILYEPLYNTLKKYIIDEGGGSSD